jgi:hypothetical protein
VITFHDMPYTDSGLWIPKVLEESLEHARTTSAPRPHLLETVPFVIYLVLTLAGIVVAILTIRDYRQSFQIAHRAYLGIDDMDISVDDTDVVFHFTMTNQGNTPAEDGEIFIVVVPVQESIQAKARRIIPVGSVGPREKTERTYRLKKDSIDPQVTAFAGVIYTEYRDVFGQNLYVLKCAMIDLVTGRRGLDSCEAEYIKKKVWGAVHLDFSVNTDSRRPFQ